MRDLAVQAPADAAKTPATCKTRLESAACCADLSAISIACGLVSCIKCDF